MVFDLNMRLGALCILLLAAGTLSGQTSRQAVFNDVNKTGGVYYAYPSGDIRTPTPAPAGYEPFYISHFGRHGSRYLIADNDYKWTMDLLEEARGAGALTPLGLDALERLRTLWKEVEGLGGDLSPLGVRQQRGIAERMLRNHPQVFAGGASVVARSTQVPRCILSMDAFSERLKELNPALEIDRRASNRDVKLLNHHTAQAVEYRSSARTWRIEYKKFEQRHVRPDRLVRSLFSDSAYVTRHVDPEQLAWALFEIAGGMQNCETRVSFHDLFEKEELFDFWQCKNYRLYVEYANAEQNMGLMMDNAKPALKDMLEQARGAIERGGRGASLRFAHDGNIIPLAMLLHLEGCYNSTAETERFYAAWSDFRVAPMGGNIQLVFFRNKRDRTDVVVKFLLNEQETLVPPLKSNLPPYYRWDDVAEYYGSILENKASNEP